MRIIERLEYMYFKQQQQQGVYLHEENRSNYVKKKFKKNPGFKKLCEMARMCLRALYCAMHSHE